jgi:hypothetical protein
MWGGFLLPSFVPLPSHFVALRLIARKEIQ